MTTASDAPTNPLESAVHGLERARVLDGPASLVGAAGRATLTRGGLDGLLGGAWLGHALHPMLTDLVVGSFTSATIIDLLQGEDGSDSAAALITVGIGAYPLTALTGVHDWSKSERGDERSRRTGLVHAALNATALGCYAASLRARRAGQSGRALSFAGASLMGVAGYLGGHLSFRLGVGVDEAASDRDG